MVVGVRLFRTWFQHSVCSLFLRLDFVQSLNVFYFFFIPRYAEFFASYEQDDTIATSGGANVYLRNYNICRKLCLSSLIVLIDISCTQRT